MKPLPVSAEWNAVVNRVAAASTAELTSDAQVLGAVNRNAAPDGIVVCAAGGLPGELHKLWRGRRPRAPHAEKRHSFIGYKDPPRARAQTAAAGPPASGAPGGQPALRADAST